MSANTKTFSNPNIDPSDDDVKSALSNIGIHAVARQQAAEQDMFRKIEAKGRYFLNTIF